MSKFGENLDALLGEVQEWTMEAIEDRYIVWGRWIEADIPPPPVTVAELEQARTILMDEKRRRAEQDSHTGSGIVA